MVVGLLRLDLFFEGSRSLKDKRQITKRIIGKVQSRFRNVSISEIDCQDLWQRTILGIGVVTNEVPFANSILDQVFNYIELMGICRILENKIEIIHC
jgi:uncharacterized protein